MTLNYAPLHVHTDASLDGFGTVEALVSDAVKKGFKSLAMTDHGTLANAITFWSLCREKGIKPILGLEGYIHYIGSDSSRNHLTLLAKTQDGFENLIALNNHAHEIGWDGRFPTFNLEDLSRYHKGLHVLTGCHASPLHDSEYESGMQFVGHLVDIMGRDNLHAEVMFISSFDDYKRSTDASERFGIPIAITNDTHFCGKGHHREQMTVYRSRVPGIDGYNSIDCYLKTYREMIATGERWVDLGVVQDGLWQTNLIAEQVEEWNMHAEPSLPLISGAEEVLVDRLREALKADIEIKGQKTIRVERLQKEMKAFRGRKLLNYVYILDDIIRYARTEGVFVGPGRGSGGGSYTLYLLGITSVDPIHYGLLFERFLSDARADYPDVDVDFESDRRGEVIAYAAEKWGAIPIATYSRYSHKSAIHDLARQLKIPKAIEVKAAESEHGSAAWDDFCEADKLRIADSTYNKMLGQIRHRGRHAGGVVITDKPIPMERLGDEIAAAWTEGMGTRELSKAGIVKYDLLGLTALSQLKTMVKLTGVDLPLVFDSKEVLDAFGEGRTTGIFQWSASEGIRKMTMELHAKSGGLTFNDLVAINALFRPGALDAGTAMKYKDFKVNPRELHPRIDPILKETYGVICFQEQVMAVYAEVSGAGLGQANELRQAFAHGKEGDRGRAEYIARFEATFMNGGEEQGFDYILLTDIWRELETHSRYSFNKSHSTAYSMIAYQMMYYLVNHFPAFIKAMMLYDTVNAQTYLMEAAQAGMEIRPPEINISTDVVELGEGEDAAVLYLPLCDIAFFGDKGLTAFLEERDKNGSFDTYAEFNERVAKRTCNNRVRKNLERVGGFRDLLGDPSDAITKYEDIDFLGTWYDELEVLGYVVPTPWIIDRYERAMAVPVPKHKRTPKGPDERFAGIVVDIKKRKTRKGKDMTIFSLSPHGSFWIMRKGLPYIPLAGDFVTGVKSAYGSAKEIERIDIT